MDRRGRGARTRAPGPPRQALVWAAGLAPLSAVAAAAGPGPLLGRFAWPDTAQAAGLLAAAVVVAVLVVAASAGVQRALPWTAVLAGAWVAGVALAAAIAGAQTARGPQVDRPVTGYVADAREASGDPVRWLRGEDERLWATPSAVDPPAARWHAPGRILAVAAARALGGDPTGASAVLLLVGATALPLLLVSVRSLAGEPAARDLAVVVVALPGTALSWGSPDAAGAALALAALAWGVSGAGRRRGVVSATGAGLLLGAAAGLDPVAVWGVAAALACTYFARRRPLLNLVTGLAVLPSLAAWSAIGVTYPAWLHAARHVADARPLAAWLLPSLVALALTAGPAVVGSMTSLRRTAAWPLLVGGGTAVAAGCTLGLARGGAERAWWGAALLLVSAATATAADRRGTAWLTAVGGGGAVVIAATVVPAWAVG